MAVDLRTRIDGQERAVDPVDFFDRELPGLLVERAATLAATAGLDLRPLTITVEGTSWTLGRTDDGELLVERTTEPERRHVRLDRQQLSDVVNDHLTPVGLMTSAALDMDGGIGRFLDWWLVLRSALDDVPVYAPGAVELPADLGRSFTLDDDPAEMRAYLEAAGYLHLRGVFTPEEMQRISDDMDAAAPSYSPDDGNSWWATLDDGTERVVRMQRFEEHSAATAALLEDPRFLAIADIPQDGHAIGWASENRIEALFKPIGVSQGISDVPWHKDCSLGRHSYECCNLTVGISVTGGGATSGQLRVVPGSHRARVWPSLLDVTQLDLPDLPLPTETGDVTVHLSCTLHMAQPPTDTERRVLYTGFRLPALDDEAVRAAARRIYSKAREGAPRNTSQSAARAS